MSKIHSLSKLHHEIQTSFIKTVEKDRNHVFPPILRISQSKEDNFLKSLMNTDRLCLSKIVHPAMKQVNCSKIENIRYTENLGIKNNQKTLQRLQAANDRKKLKQNRSVLKKISASQKSQTTRLPRTSFNETIHKKNQKILSFVSEKIKQQAETKPIKEHHVCVTDRESKVNLRDKVNSCKVATKKAGFPFSKKQYQNLKLSQQFDDEEQKLSIIPAQVEEQSGDFISFKTYNELIVF